MSLFAIKAQSRTVEDTRLNARQAQEVMTVILGDFAEKRAEGAEAEWPTETGFSKAGIEWGVDGVGTGALAFVQDLVWYAGFVRIPSGPAWLLLVTEPVINEEAELASDLADSVADALLRAF